MATETHMRVTKHGSKEWQALVAEGWETHEVSVYGNAYMIYVGTLK